MSALDRSCAACNADAGEPCDPFCIGLAARDDGTKPTPYVLHYTSADGPRDDATWSVYAEDYRDADDAEPIDGSQRVVESGFLDQEAADARAAEIQGRRA